MKNFKNLTNDKLSNIMREIRTALLLSESSIKAFYYDFIENKIILKVNYAYISRYRIKNLNKELKNMYWSFLFNEFNFYFE